MNLPVKPAVKPVVFLVDQQRMDDPRFIEALQALPAEVESEIVYFEEKKDLTKLLRELDPKKYDRALVCGGDGTLHYVAEEYLKLPPEMRLPLGILPMGTANDFARYSGFAQGDFAEAVRATVCAPVRYVDVGLVNGRTFINAVSGGVAAKSTTEVAPFLKAMFGKFSYYLTGLSKATAIESQKITFRDDDPGSISGTSTSGTVFGDLKTGLQVDCIAFAVGNSLSAGGGFKIAPDAKLDDGVLDVLIVPRQGLMEIAGLAAELFKEKPDLEGHQALTFKTKRLEILCEKDLQINLDGEPITDRKFVFEIAPKAIRLAVNRDVMSDMQTTADESRGRVSSPDPEPAH